MLSQKQLAEEARKEREYNKLSEAIINKSPFGQWYPLMIGASNLLRKNLKKVVGIDEDGRPLVVYKTDIGKALGVWSTPTHEVISKDLSRNDWKGALGALLGGGQIAEIRKQKKAKFFDISPKEVGEQYNKTLVEARKKAQQQGKPEPKEREVTIIDDGTDNAPDVENKSEINYVPIVIISAIGLATVIGIAIHLKNK